MLNSTTKRLSLLEMLWLGLPVAIWLAYQPLIHFGQDSTMNFELSVAMIYACVLALASLPSIWRQRRELIKKRAVWLSGLFIVVSILSLIWTANLTRGLLTVGVGGMLYAIFLGAVAELGRLRRILPKVVRVYIYSALVVCGLAVLQFFAGLWFDDSLTLLCAGCVAEQFGFVRPNVFLIEPQFLGSALLPAALLLTHRAVSGAKNRQLWLALFIVVLVLVLTISRGALLAFAVGVILLLAVSRYRLKHWLAVFGVFVISLSAALSLQGLAGKINPSIEETFSGAATKSLHQLTMGLVDIRPEDNPAAGPTETTTVGDGVGATEPNFDGYVEESTDARTTRSSLALQRWGVDTGTMFFGVGVGSAGVAINQMFPDQLGAREIVQNEYVEILLERGLIGLAAFLVILVGLFVLTRQQKWLWSIIAAFMVQWLFFSGYPNALHIYLALVLIAVIGLRPQRQKAS